MSVRFCSHMIHFHWQSKWRGGGLAPFGGDSFPTQWHSEEAGQNQRSVGLCSEKSCNNLYLTNSAVHVWLQQHSRYSRLTKPTHWLTSKNSIGGAHKTGTHNHQDHEHNCHDKSLDIMHSITGNSNTGSSRLYLLKQHMHNDMCISDSPGMESRLPPSLQPLCPWWRTQTNKRSQENQ